MKIKNFYIIFFCLIAAGLTFLSLIFFNDFISLEDFNKTEISKQNILNTATLIVSAIGVGTSGYIMQSITRNNLSTPDTIGITPILSLGLVISTIFTLNFISSFFLSLSLGIMVAIIITIYIAKIKKASINIVVIGIIFSTLIYSLNLLLTEYFNIPRKIAGILFTSKPMMSIKKFVALSVITFCSMIFILLIHKKIKIIENGQITTRNSGVNYKLIICLAIFNVVVLSTCATLMAGSIVFLSLAGPLIARYIFKGSFLKNLIISIIFTIIFILSGDIIVSYWSFVPISITSVTISSMMIIWKLVKKWK